MITKTVTLPNGIIAETGEVLRELELRQLDGGDEDMIRDKHSLREGNVLERLLKRCIVRVESETDPANIAKLFDKGMLLADTTFLLVYLRMHGIDPVYRFHYMCRCDHRSLQKIVLNNLDVTEQSEDYRGRREIPLIVEGRTIVIRPLYASDSKLLETLKQQYPKERGTRELLVQVKSVEGEGKITAPVIKSWSWAFRNTLRNKIDETTGGINTQLIITCPNCDHTEVEAMPIDLRDFFFPKAVGSAMVMTASQYRDSGMILACLDADGTGALKPSETSPSKSVSIT